MNDQDNILTDSELDAEMEQIHRQHYLEQHPNRLKSVNWLAVRKPLDHLVTGYLPRTGLGQMYGPSYSGKSYAAINLALSVAAGLKEWMGLPLRVSGPQRVVYVAAEGGQPFWDAVEAWLKVHPGADLSGLFVLDGGEGDALYIASPFDEQPGENVSLNRLEVEIDDRFSGDVPALVIIDPQINVMPTVDESNNKEMVAVMATLKRWADMNDLLLLLVHHTGHDASRARGASGQKGVVDIMCKVESKAGAGQISFDKVKGAAQPEPIKFRLEGVDIVGGSKKGAYMTRADGYVSKEDAEAFTDQIERNAVLAAVREGLTSASQIASSVNLNRNKVAAHLSALAGDNRVTNSGSPSRPCWAVAQ